MKLIDKYPCICEFNELIVSVIYIIKFENYYEGNVKIVRIFVLEDKE